MPTNLPSAHSGNGYHLSIDEIPDEDPAKQQNLPRATLVLQGIKGDRTFFRQLTRLRGACGTTVQRYDEGMRYTFLVPAQMRTTHDPQWLVGELDTIVSDLKQRSVRK